MKVLDKNGAEVDIPDEHAQAALTSGQYGLAAGTRVPIRTRTGKVGTIPIESLGQATAAGARLLSEQQHLEATHAGALDTAAATVEGAVRGATFGLSDPAIVGAMDLVAPDKAEAVRKHLEAEKLAHPWAEGAGEIGGNIATALLTGGASEVAAPEEVAAFGAEHAGQAASLADALRAGTTPYRVAADMAESTAARTAATHALEGTGEVGQTLLARVLKHAGEGAVLGGAQGAGNAISEDTLTGNHDLTAQKFLASAGEGALFGALAGGGLTLGAEGAKAAVGRLAPQASKLAEDQAFRSLFISSDKAAVKSAERIAGGTRGVGRELLDRGLIQSGDTIDSIAPRVAEARQQAGAELGKILDTADKAGMEGPQVSSIFRRIDENVMPRLEKLPSLNSGTIRRINDLKDDIARAAMLEDSSEVAAREKLPETFKTPRLSFTQAQQLRARIDDAIKFNTNPMMPHNELNDALRGVRTAIEQEIESSGDKAAKKIGASFVDEYKAAKISYARLAVADNAAQQALTRKVANRAFSPTDYLAGIGGISAAASGHPSGLALGLLHHVVRERGNATSAIMLDKLSALGAIEQGAARFDRQLSRGVAQITRPGKLAAPLIRTSEATTEERMDAVRRIAAGQATPAAHIAGPLTPHAPKIANAMLSASSRAAQYLANLLPQPAMEGEVTPQKKPVYSIAETTKFNRAYDVLHDPNLLLQHAHDGMLTKDEVMAVKTTNPDLYQHMCDELRKEIAEHGSSLTYTRRVQLSVLLGEPVDPTMAPRILTQLQKPQGGSTPPGGPSKPHGHVGAIKTPKDIGKSTALTGLGKETLLNH